ncbi:cytochrome P450 [Micromonospora sp. WMMD812]|uniref:cytochrome P450 n=1 Tax=Micromonospora sp. WMMD812 TaxID=3015152 RepID=UPI00248B3150|nr:cytochrome P450 [Micromonospora sp. WMMD812]WBB69270.1 cytochrome P450 [Micromonospora sp. WMMD812]
MTYGPRDLADPRLYRDGEPERLWARMRAAGPVQWIDRRDREPFWAVLGHAAAVAVLRDPARFSSAGGMRLDDNPAAVRSSANRMLIVTDPPRHAQLRRVMNAAFTPRMVARLRDTMRATVRFVLDEALERETCDLVRVAARLPVSVICDLLGVPPKDWDFMLDRTMTAFGHGNRGADPAAMAQAHTDILFYYAELVERRRREPGEDVVTALVNGRVDGEPLTDEEIYLNCDGLVSGGNETSRHATVGGVRALMAHPDEWARMAGGAVPMDTAVPEILRFTSPAMHVARVATTDLEIEGIRIRAGQRVAVWLAAANRDPRTFDRPDVLDAGRSPNRHLALAPGEHYCLGAALAEMELTVMFEELCDRVRLPEPAGPAVRLHSNLIWGYESMPVRLRARRARVAAPAPLSGPARAGEPG